jgi:DNA-binding FadR family transcriptional regulator
MRDLAPPQHATDVAPGDGDGDAARAAAFLRAMISDGRLPADGRLPTERELAAELDLGRRAVRKALEELQREGLVWRRQGKGTFAGQAPDPAGILAARQSGSVDPMTVMEARLCLEPALAALAASRASPEDVARLRGLARRATAAPDAPQAELWDGALHRLIARIAGNPILLASFSFLDEVRLGGDWQARRHRARTPETQALYDQQHRAIVGAIAAADPAAADAAMRAHLSALAAALERTGDGR